MKTILALEASSDTASVCLWGGGEVLAEVEFYSKQSLSAELFPVLARVLEGAPPVGMIVVGLGPGSYAGVRITIAAALGLQCIWGCEIKGIPSVAVLGLQGESYQAIGDARRGTWYYSQVVDGLCVDGPVLLESSEMLRRALAKGCGPVRSTEILQDEWGTVVSVPSASALARLAAIGRGIVQSTDLEPLYLREPHITLPRVP